MTLGVIRKALSGFYFVRTGENEEFMCRGRGILRREGTTPLVGDRVEITVQDEEEGVIERVYPRANAFVRPPVANIDVFVCVIAAAEPAPNPEILDRFLVTAEAARVPSVICVNKTDLDSSVPEKTMDVYGGLYPIALTSAATRSGLSDLAEMIAGRAAAFAGPSGVGKSSLIGMLTDGVAETGEISRKTNRGRHTTRHVEIYDTDFGARIYDTPGYTSFTGTFPPFGDGLAECFPDISDLAKGCRFDDCSHREEPGCAVRGAMEAGSLARSRYESYVRMFGSADGKGN